MPDHHDPLRHIFDDLVAMPSPTTEQTESARRALSVVIRDEAPGESIHPRLRLGVAVAAVLAFVVAITVVAPWNRSPAEAFLGEVAEAARNITPDEMPQGSYIYFVTEQLVWGGTEGSLGDELVRVDYLIPSTTESWWQDGTVRNETTVGRPTFFDPEDEAFYYDHGLDKSDFVGETRTETLTGIKSRIDPEEWSTIPEQLAVEMRQAAEADPSEEPIDAKMMGVAYRLLNPRVFASPMLRAAVIDVLATLDVDQQRLDGGRVSASLTYDRRYFGTIRLEFVFDGEGYLVERSSTAISGDEEGILSPGTVYEIITQTPPVVVPKAGVRPTLLTGSASGG